ncbi:MAG: BON domain-containing protein [Candidatus Sphingomonas colombiensis]|nr:BON domain-containing protein [Sphingomonas sp.]WEK43227.1 MAG: BON domain-containing protein [Sphingomonas sp.]
MKKTDSQVQHDVLAELECEPRVDHGDINVAVNGGVVTLSGYAKNYPGKVAAEKAARRVAGVRAIIEEIMVRLVPDPETADHEIAKRILDAFAWNVSVSHDNINATVEHGWVTLTGVVDWFYQSNEASTVAGKIGGVLGISNLLEVREQPTSDNVRDQILAAFTRQADLDADTVTVVTDRGTVKLGGKVNAWNRRGIAERAAWAAPGVTRVEDNIIVVF